MTAVPLKPAAIAQLTALEVLHLTSCELRPTERAPVTSCFLVKAAGASELLAAIAQLTQLRQLCLDQINLYAIQEQTWEMMHPTMNGGVRIFIHNNHDDRIHLQPFSALTASDRLERLVLVYRDDDTDPATKSQPVPLHSFDYMLPSGRKLLGLTELVLDSYGPDRDAWESLRAGRWGHQSIDDIDTKEGNGCLVEWDLGRIASRCPNLKRLTLNGVLEAKWDFDDDEDVAFSFRPVQRRLQLTHLCLGGPWLVNDIAAVIAGMTSLHSLQLHNAPQLAANGLQTLTALQQLRELRLDFVGCVRGWNYCCEADAEAQEPNVWRQLAGELRPIRQSQRYVSDDDIYDPKVNIDDWSDGPESDCSQGSDAGSDS